MVLGLRMGQKGEQTVVVVAVDSMVESKTMDEEQTRVACFLERNTRVEP